MFLFIDNINSTSEEKIIPSALTMIGITVTLMFLSCFFFFLLIWVFYPDIFPILHYFCLYSTQTAMIPVRSSFLYPWCLDLVSWPGMGDHFIFHLPHPHQTLYLYFYPFSVTDSSLYLQYLLESSILSCLHSSW